jgi:hypothetical protein
MQSALLGLVGCAMVSDPFHGAVSGAFAPLGYPALFPLAVGLWMGGISALNFYEAGKHVLLAQRLLSVVMGGAVYHHVLEGKPAGSIGAIVFLGMSVYIPVTKGLVALPEAAITAAGLAGIGYAIGVLLPKSVAVEKKANKKA